MWRIKTDHISFRIYSSTIDPTEFFERSLRRNWSDWIKYRSMENICFSIELRRNLRWMSDVLRFISEKTSSHRWDSRMNLRKPPLVKSRSNSARFALSIYVKCETEQHNDWWARWQNVGYNEQAEFTGKTCHEIFNGTRLDFLGVFLVSIESKEKVHWDPVKIGLHFRGKSSKILLFFSHWHELMRAK